MRPCGNRDSFYRNSFDFASNLGDDGGVHFFALDFFAKEFFEGFLDVVMLKAPRATFDIFHEFGELILSELAIER